MSSSRVLREMTEDMRMLQNYIFGSGKFISEAALQLSSGLAMYHPFIGSLPVPGGATNRNFRLTGMIIETMKVTPINATTANIILIVKNPDSYHKDFFLDRALEFAFSKILEGFETLLAGCGLNA